MANDITYKQVEEYCKKRDLVIVTHDYFQAMQALRQPNGPTQAFLEQARAYEKLKVTEIKLKEARKEAAAANKRYKQLKKEFFKYRNEHTESDCNPYLAKIRDLEQQIEAMKAHKEEN